MIKAIRNLMNDPAVGRIFGAAYVGLGIAILQNVVTRLGDQADELQGRLDQLRIRTGDQAELLAAQNLQLAARAHKLKRLAEQYAGDDQDAADDDDRAADDDVPADCVTDPL